MVGVASEVNPTSDSADVSAAAAPPPGRGRGRGGRGGGGGGGGGRGGAAGLQAGAYTVRMTVDGQSYTQAVTVKPDPRGAPSGLNN